MQLACIGTYTKAHEKRVPLHPNHLKEMPETLRQQLCFDQGYGLNFGVSDAELASLSGGVAPRTELLASADAVLLLKPLAADLAQLKDGALLWGWPHCVQQREVVQQAIDKRLTVIAMERMFPWGPDGTRGQHLFYKNGEIAGVAAVHHGMNLWGCDGHYGPPLSAVVIGTGSSSRGAILALKGRGVQQIQVIEIRPDFKARDQQTGCQYLTLKAESMTVHRHALDPGQPILELLTPADIIVNAVFQNPNAPLYFLRPGEEKQLKPGAFILDISCDEGMGFPFSQPTTFAEPLIEFAHFTYYGVDHIPSMYWKSASWEVSLALLPYFEPLVQNTWRENIALFHALDIDQGQIVDPAILKFQQRAPDYPHPILACP